MKNRFFRACLKIQRGAVFAARAGWQGATKENSLHSSSTEEQRRQPALAAKTLRAAGLLTLGFVVACVTARYGDAPPAPPRPKSKSLAAAPLSIFRQALIGAILAAVLSVGCGQKDNARNSQVGTAKSTAQSGVTNQVLTAGTPAPITVQTPVMQPILTAWQEGNGPAAIARFTGANWNARPLFPASMAVGLTESQFKGLSGSDRNLRNNEMMAQLDLIKQIVMTINEAGQDAAAKGDNIRALKLFTALNQCGAALDDPAAQILVKQVGQVCKGMGGRGLAKLGQ